MTEAPILIFFVFSITLLFVYVLMIVMFIKGWDKTETFISAKNTMGYNTKVSLIIPVRNEEKNIPILLKCILNQNYPSHLIEIILADDSSEDNTKTFIKNLIAQNPKVNMQLLELPEVENNYSPKKRAIQKAVEICIGDFIITTDADCTMGCDWISTLVSFYQSTNAKLIVAPVKIKIETEATFLDAFQKYDLMSLVLSAAASLHFKKPLLCNGANLAFEKKAYQDIYPELKGKKLASGDDMFLMLAIKNKYPGSVQFVKSKEAIVETAAQKNLIALLNQRKRWVSKGLSYNDNYVFFISMFILLVNLFLLITGIISFLSIRISFLFLLLFLTKTGTDFIFLSSASQFFNEKINPGKIALMVLLYPYFILLIAGMSLKKKYIWKERKLN